MARIARITAAEVADADLRAVMERLGGDEAFGVYAHAAGPFKAFLAFLASVKYAGRLPFAEKELVRLRIAELNDCER
jgi:alkylhydroperoxidase family enzyme